MKWLVFPNSGKKTLLSTLAFTGVLALIIWVNTTSASAAPPSPSSPPPKCSTTSIGNIYLTTNNDTIPILQDVVERTNFGGVGNDVKTEVMSAISNNPTWIAGVVTPANPATANPLSDYYLIIRIWDIGSTMSSATEGVSYGYYPISTTDNHFIRHEGNTAHKQIILRFRRDQTITDKWVFTPITNFPYGVVEASHWTTPKDSTIANSLTRVVAPSNWAELQSGGLNCIVGSSNIYKYDKPYVDVPNGGLGEQAEEDNNWWSSLTNGISTLVDFVKKMPEIIASLFIPKASTINTIVTDFTTFFDNKLGILLFPFELFSDFFTVLTSTGGWDNWLGDSLTCSASTTVHSWEFGHYFGKSYRISMCAFKSTMPAIHTLLLLFVRAAAVFSLATFLLNAHRRNIQK